MWRHHPQTAELVRLVSSGALGRVRLVRAAFSFRLTDEEDIRLSAGLEGGSLMDVGCYCVSAIRLLAGEPVCVYGEQVLGPTGVDVAFTGTAVCADDVLAHFDCGFAMPYRAALEIAGEDGVALLSDPWHATRPGIVLRRRDERRARRDPGGELVPAAARERGRGDPRRGAAPARPPGRGGAGARARGAVRGRRRRRDRRDLPRSAATGARVTYVPSPDRYDRMEYRRSGRSGLKLPAMSLGLWQNFGGEQATRAQPRARPPRLRPRHHALRPGEQLRPAVRLRRGDVRHADGAGPAPVPRRARHLDEGGLGHVAGPVRGVRVAQVPAREPRPVAQAHEARLRRHLLLAPAGPGDAARGDDGRARHRRPTGQGAVRRHLVVLARDDARGAPDPGRARHAAAHPPAVLLDAEPLDRGRPARRPRRARHRLHLLLAARAGDADRSLPRAASRRDRGRRSTARCRRRCSPSRRWRRSGR